MIRRPPRSTLFPYTTLFRSEEAATSEETDPWEISISYVAKAGNRGPIGRLPSGRLVDWVQRSDYPREQAALQAFGAVTKPLGTQSPEETLRSEERRVGKECR